MLPSAYIRGHRRPLLHAGTLDLERHLAIKLRASERYGHFAARLAIGSVGTIGQRRAHHARRKRQIRLRHFVADAKSHGAQTEIITAVVSFLGLCSDYNRFQGASLRGVRDNDSFDARAATRAWQFDDIRRCQREPRCAIGRSENARLSETAVREIRLVMVPDVNRIERSEEHTSELQSLRH